jgi:hypothetical protein
MRFAYPGKLATSVRGRLKRLQTGANPAELQLGHDCSAEQCTTLLGHLDLKWYQASRRSSEGPRTTIDLCGGGLGGAYFRIGGRTFDRKDPLGRMSYQGAQHLQTLAALTDYDRGREDAERTWVWEEWAGHYEWKEAAVIRGSGTLHRWALDQIVVVRDEERVRLGYVTRVAHDMHGEFALSLKMYSGTPKAMAVRPLSTAVGEDPPLPVVMLGETPDDKPSLILPPRTYNASRVLRSLDPGPEKRFRLTRLVQRGADFERVEFEETI